MTEPPMMDMLDVEAFHAAREIDALKAQIQRMREMLKLLEWCGVDRTAFVADLGGEVTLHRCPVCNHPKECANYHARDCELAALLKETE